MKEMLWIGLIGCLLRGALGNNTTRVLYHVSIIDHIGLAESIARSGNPLLLGRDLLLNKASITGRGKARHRASHVAERRAPPLMVSGRLFAFNHRLYFTAGIGDESHGLFGSIKRSEEQDDHDSHK